VPVQRPPAIEAPSLPGSPGAGKGRLSLMIGGNRRWCTYPDDRIVRPPVKPGTVEPRNEVYTFGYRFTVSAVKRGQADTPLMLFESPIFQTATMLPASKTGDSKRVGGKGPVIMEDPDQRRAKPPRPPISPTTLVPRWQEENRCVTLPESMDFDLDPGTYDVYMAFDIMGREGGWAHRSSGYLTDVQVENARRTRLDGLINGTGSKRQVEIESSTIDPAPAASQGATGP